MFKLTTKQEEANALLGSPAGHVLLYGGSRSGKTFLELRAMVIRALKAPGSRHAVLRFRFNAVKASIVYDTFPKVMRLCWPRIDSSVSKSDWVWRGPGGSEIWFGGLDDKQRVEKILGNEYATILFNECSQIPFASREMAMTRLAQKAMVQAKGVEPHELALKAYYDENPPDKGHWTYRLFVEKCDPETRQPLRDPTAYASLLMNPGDNRDNLPAAYFKTLAGLSDRMRRRFELGQFRDSNPAALFKQEDIDRWRVTTEELPDFQRIVVAVDPSGAGDVENADNDAIGIVVAALGVDGNGYLLEDLTLKAGPSTWGKVVATAFDRHEADCVVAETNYGGAMVRHVVQTARPNTHFREVKASRGKVVRAEPVSALVEQGKVRLVGYFHDLEDELAGFTTNGYTGERSPNRGDAFVWAFAELFPALVRPKVDEEQLGERAFDTMGDDSWMAL